MSKRKVALIILALTLVSVPALIFAEDKPGKTNVASSVAKTTPASTSTSASATSAQKGAMQMGLDLQQLEKDLSLTPDQQTKVNDIRSKSRQDISQAIVDARAKIHDTRVKANDKIQVLLNDTQKEKFKQFRAKYGI